MTSWVSAKVSLRREWAPGLVTLGVDVTPAFKPGQFMNIGRSIDGELIRRSYSLASAPGAAAEFYLNNVETGRLSPHLLDLQVGDSVELETKAYGFFTLEYLPEALDVWLLASGTGLGPFISMLRSGEIIRRFERIVIVHGVRQAAHLGYREELERLRLTHPGRVSVVPVLSREPALLGGLSGRIPEHITNGQIEALAGFGLSLERSHVLICGNPEMIRDVSAVLGARGLKKHRQRTPGHVTSESFW